MFLRECEARSVIKMTKHNRDYFYRLIESKRGEKACWELRREVKEQWLKQQEKQGGVAVAQNTGLKILDIG